MPKGKPPNRRAEARSAPRPLVDRPLRAACGNVHGSRTGPIVFSATPVAPLISWYDLPSRWNMRTISASRAGSSCNSRSISSRSSTRCGHPPHPDACSASGESERRCAIGRLRISWTTTRRAINREVSRQTALAAEMSKDGEIVANESEEDFRAQIVSVIPSQVDVPNADRVVDNVCDQPEKTVNEILPRPWLALQASFQQISIDFR